MACWIRCGGPTLRPVRRSALGQAQHKRRSLALTLRGQAAALGYGTYRHACQGHGWIDPAATEHAALLWADEAQLATLEWAPADIPAVDEILAQMSAW